MKAMKVRNIFSALFVSLVAMVSCQQIEVNNHDDIRAPKQLNVLADEYNVGWEGETIDLSFTTNSFWGVEFLGWKDEIIQEGDTARVVVNAAWMSTPVIYGEGNATLQVKIAANDKSRRAREGYIKVFTGDENVCKMIPVVQSGNPDYEGPEGLPILDLYFDFTTNFMGWPTASQSTGEYVYPLDGVDYSFEFGRCNMGNYLVIHNVGAYLGLPAIENYRLTKVTAVVSSNNSKARGAAVSADPAGTILVSEDIEWPAAPSVEVVYELEDTQYNTRYYLVNTPGHPTGGLPTAGLTLHYEP